MLDIIICDITVDLAGMVPLQRIHLDMIGLPVVWIRSVPDQREAFPFVHTIT